MISSFSKLRSYNILSNLTRRDCSLLFQPKRSIKWNSSAKVINCQHTFTTKPTYSYISRVENFRLASFRTLTLNPITSKANFVRRQTTSTNFPPSPTVDLSKKPKGSRVRPKSSSVDTMSPEAKRTVKILGYTSVMLGIGFIIYSGELYI